MVGARQAEELRQGTNAVADLAVSDLRELFGSLNFDDLDASRDLLLDLTPELVARYGGLNGDLAAEWYDDVRPAYGDGYTAAPAVVASAERVQGSVRFAAGELWTAPPNVLVVMEGMLRRLVLETARNTIVDGVADDPEGVGWQRQVRPNACKFCRMLAGRGGVYRSEKSVAFAAHDHCHCVAVPTWDTSLPEVPVAAYRASERLEKVRRRAADASNPTDQRRAQSVLDRHRKTTRAYLRSMDD